MGVNIEEWFDPPVGTWQFMLVKAVHVLEESLLVHLFLESWHPLEKLLLNLFLSS